MFKKPFKVSGSHSLSNKDKKKLREKLVNKQGYSTTLVDYILNDANFGDDDELRVCKVANSKIAFYQRGANPLLYCADGDKLKSEVPIEPTLYLLFLQRTVIGPEVELTTYDSAGSLRVYLKQGVERFLMRGADLMWPGIFYVSPDNFKQYDSVIILARNTLISDYISTLD